MNPLFEKPTVDDVVIAMTAVAAVVPFFPQTDVGIALIAEDVHSFVGTREQLDWFERKARGFITKYEGVPQLRALYCTKYSPADGIEPTVECAGMTEDVLEAQHSRRVMDENEKRLAEYRRQARLAPPEDLEPLQLPEAKPIPEGNPLVHRQARALSAGAQLAMVEGAIACSWCAEGFARVRSSVSSNFIHTDTPVGRVVCKNRSASDACPGGRLSEERRLLLLFLLGVAGVLAQAPTTPPAPTGLPATPSAWAGFIAGGALSGRCGCPGD